MEKKIDFFELLDRSDRRFAKDIEISSKREFFHPLQVIYTQGSLPEAVYIVISGVAEAITCSPDGKQTRPLAYMTRGECFGELGVLSGKNRVATVRTREACEVMKFESGAFLRLMETYPGFGLYISQCMATRLYDTSQRDHETTYGVELCGQLQCFDLLTIFQAITGASHTGELRLSDYNQDIIGSFFFNQGQVQYARYVHLEGLEAIWEGFLQSVTEGNFAFELMEQPRLPFDAAKEITLQNNDLLMQGATKRDVYLEYPEELRKMEGRLSLETTSLIWEDEETQEVVTRLLELCAKRPQPLNTLWRRMGYSHITFLQVIHELILSGQAKLVSESAFKQTGPIPVNL